MLLTIGVLLISSIFQAPASGVFQVSSPEDEFAFFTVTLEVKDSSDSAIAGAQVLAFSDDWGIRIPGSLEASTFLTTDSAGHATFQVVKGMWTFFVSHSEPGNCFFLTASVGVQSSTMITLKPTTTFSVSVLSMSGSPIDIDEFRIVDESHAPILPTTLCGTTIAGQISVAVNSQGPFRILAVHKPSSSEGYYLLATGVTASQNLSIQPTPASTASVTFRAFAADNSPTAGSIDVILPSFDINYVVSGFSFTDTATIVFTPMPVMFYPRLSSAGWFFGFSPEAYQLSAGSSFDVRFGGPLTEQLQVIPHASTGQGGSPNFAPMTQVWLKISDHFGHVLMLMSTPSGSPAFAFTLTRGGSVIYQSTMFIVLVPSIPQEYSDSDPPNYQLTGDLGPFGTFSLGGPLISSDTSYQIDMSPSTHFRTAIPVGFGAQTERNKAFMDRLYEVAQDMTGQPIYGDIQYEVDIQGGGFSWETLPAPTKVLLVIQVDMDPLFPRSLFFASHEFGHTRNLRDPTDMAIDFWGESYATLIAIEGISRIIDPKMWLWGTGQHDFFFYHLQGRPVSDRSQQIEASQFVLAYLQKKFGWDIHYRFFSEWSTDLASKAQTLSANGFQASEVYATLYSFLAGQNLAWIFDTAGLGVTEDRVTHGLALISGPQTVSTTTTTTTTTVLTSATTTIMTSSTSTVLTTTFVTLPYTPTVTETRTFTSTSTSYSPTLTTTTTVFVTPTTTFTTATQPLAVVTVTETTTSTVWFTTQILSLFLTTSTVTYYVIPAAQTVTESTTVSTTLTTATYTTETATVTIPEFSYGLVVLLVVTLLSLVLLRRPKRKNAMDADTQNHK